MSRITVDFEKICKEKKDKIAFIYEDKRKGFIKKSFAELYKDVDEALIYLRQKGISKKKKILIFTPPSYELVVFMLACMKLGALLMYVDVWAGKKLINETLAEYKADYIVVSQKTSFLRLGFGDIKKIKKLLFIDGFTQRKACKKSSGSPIYDDIKEDDKALLTMTTGSTGKPKTAVRTHKDLYEQLRLVNLNMPPREDQVVLTTAFMYSFANILKGFTSVLPGIGLSCPFDFWLNLRLKKLRKLPITTIITSPDFCLRTDNYYKRLENIYIGGANLNINEAKRIGKKYSNSDITYIYGATECNLIAKIDLREYISILERKRLACLGVNACGVDIKIGDNNEISVSSEAILKNYTSSKRDNCEIDANGVFWHKTGDAGVIKGDKLYYLGRFDVYAKKGTKRLHTNPIEQELIISFPKLLKCAFFYYKGKNHLLYESNTGHTGKLQQDIEKYLKKKGFEGLEIRRLKKIPCDKKHHTKKDYRKLKNMV